MQRHVTPNETRVTRSDGAGSPDASEKDRFDDAIAPSLDAIRGGGGATDQKLSEIASVISSEAHQSGLAAEQMLVAVKARWSLVAAPWRESAIESYYDVQERLVSCCIEAYYASRVL